ncbi:MAG: carbohydrate-binding family 9-like protein [Planctomycetota bacterium]|nr:carbohydrate-binding family 9-like protein [Planctomycetota bacterium]
MAGALEAGASVGGMAAAGMASPPAAVPAAAMTVGSAEIPPVVVEAAERPRKSGSRKKQLLLIGAGACLGLLLLAAASLIVSLRGGGAATKTAAGTGAGAAKTERRDPRPFPKPPTTERPALDSGKVAKAEPAGKTPEPEETVRAGDGTSGDREKPEDAEGTGTARHRKDPDPVAAPKPSPPTAGEMYNGLPLVRVPAPRIEPRIDGDLGDPAWSDARPLRMTWLDGRKGRPPPVETTAYVLASREKLFIAFQCMEPNIGRLKGKASERDSNIWEDDEVEIFILPGPDHTKTYYQFIFNCRGARFDGVNKGNTRWNPDYELAVKIGGNYWSAEFAIQWRQFTEHKGSPARLWRLNLTRERHAGLSDPESYGWSPVFSRHSHTPSKFGYAFFEALAGAVPPDFRP